MNLLLTSRNPHLFFQKWIVIMAILVVAIFVYNSTISTKPKTEGFTQIEPFVLKQNANIYDEFYADIYDSLHDTKTRIQPELIDIIKMTNPTHLNSVFLDVGSGTGNMVNELVEAGYNAYGIEKSKDMITCTTKQFPDIEIVNADVLDSMMFEKSTFTHILCTYFTIYQLENKEKFFRNCYYWMKPNSYLVLHLVHPDKFQNIVPYANVEITSTTNTNGHKLTNRVVFDDFKYDASYEIPTDKSKQCTFTEMLTDNNTNHIRQNEQILYLESIDDIINLASKNGFIIKGKSNMSNVDNNQFLYILERVM